MFVTVSIQRLFQTCYNHACYNLGTTLSQPENNHVILYGQVLILARSHLCETNINFVCYNDVLIQDHVSARASRKPPRSEGSHQPLTPKPATSDESSSMKDELKKSYKRIADLETRVHDLTLQSSLVSVWGRVWGVGCE